jgi:predicted HTH domain antitoxin
MTAEVDIIKEGMVCLIRAGYYKDREALLEESFRTLLEVKPALRSEMAIELYRSGKVSLSRAAEVAGTSQEGFKNILEQKGIERAIEPSSREEIKRGVESILDLKISLLESVPRSLPQRS